MYIGKIIKNKKIFSITGEEESKLNFYIDKKIISQVVIESETYETITRYYGFITEILENMEDEAVNSVLYYIPAYEYYLKNILSSDKPTPKFESMRFFIMYDSQEDADIFFKKFVELKLKT